MKSFFLYTFLKKAEKGIGLDLRYLIKGGFWLGVSQIIGVLGAFLLSVIYANWVDVSDYGTYKFIASVAGIVSGFALTGAATTILQSLSKGYGGSFYIEKRAYLFWSVPSLVGGLIISCYYFFHQEFVLGTGIFISVLANYILSYLLFHNALLNAKKDFRRLSINQSINSIVLVGAISIGAYSGLNTALWLTILFYGTQIVFQFFAYRKTLELYTPNNDIDPHNHNFSKHLSIINILANVAEYMDKILIFHFLGTTQVALYAFSTGIPDQIRTLNKFANALVLPKLSGKTDEELKTSVRRQEHKYLIFSICITALFALVAPFIYKIFFPRYAQAAMYAVLYLISLPLSALGIMQGYALQLKKDIRSLHIVNVSASVSKILLFVVLIPLFGIMGAISSVLISKIIASGLQIYLYRKLFSKT